MNITNLFRIAMKAISANKMRSFLTMLGIIIGVSSVIIMLALGTGSKATIMQEIEDVDPGTLMIVPGPKYEDTGGNWLPEYSQTITQDDYHSILEKNKYLKAICPMVYTSGQFINGKNNHSGSVQGVNNEFLDINGLTIAEGDMFTDAEIKGSAKVCIVGKTVVDKLFPNEADPIGAVIRINTIPVRVVGVLKSKGRTAFGQDQDDIVLMPYTTVMKRMISQNYYDMIYVAASSKEMSSLAKKDVTEILRENHKLKDGDMQDFRVESLEEATSMVDTVMNVLTLLLSCIAGISLLVGGIGIMNIMYVSVTERTKEIGLRMSVGARGIDILSQFLIEAILISVTGGVIGVLIGIGLSMLMKTVLHWPVSIQAWTVLLSFLVCTITGVFFGWYPAKKAANLDPIEALRYE